MQDGSRRGSRREIHDRTRAQHEDNVRIHGCKRAERPLLRCRERQGLTVEPLGLRHLIEPAAKNHTVRTARKPQGLTEPSRLLSLRVVSVPRIAAHGAEQFLSETLRELPPKGLDPTTVYERRPGSLVARHARKVSD